MTQHQVLFCPFCRESFEGRATCPDHELGLLPFDQLAPGPLAHEDDDEDAGVAPPAEEDRRLSLLEPRFGRAVVALGALLAGGAMLAELATLGGRALRTYQIAAALPSLWTPMLAAFCAIFVLVRRRTRRLLAGLRLVVPLLGAVVGLTSALAAARLGSSVLRAPAIYAMAIACVLLMAGGARLGVGASPRSPSEPP